eukprot:11206907-Heterocapsa_arctica.AAC.1
MPCSHVSCPPPACQYIALAHACPAWDAIQVQSATMRRLRGEADTTCSRRGTDDATVLFDEPTSRKFWARLKA